jgi:hypothetical protein
MRCAFFAVTPDFEPRRIVTAPFPTGPVFSKIVEIARSARPSPSMSPVAIAYPKR